MAADGDPQTLNAQLQTVLDVANLTLPEDQVKILKREIQKTMDMLVGPSNSRKRNAVHREGTNCSPASSSINPRLRVPEGEIPTELLAGKFRCEGCSEWVALRDEDGFTLAPWLTHILTCGKSKLAIKSNARPPYDNTVSQNASKAQSQLSLPLPVTPEIPTNDSVALHSTSTRMPTFPSFKRTKQFLSPPEAGSHELTDKAVSGTTPIDKNYVNILRTDSPPTKRRRPNSTEAERMEAFLTDPQVAEVDPYRVLCAVCDKWIKLRNNSRYCLVPWECHKVCCERAAPKKPLVASVSAQVEDLPNALDSNTDTVAPKGEPSGAHNQARQPSRLRIVAAEQRRAALEADPHAGTVERDRILCALCQKWVRLHPNASYCRAQWQRHIKRCAVKHRNHGSLKSHSDIDPSEESSTGDNMAAKGDSTLTEPDDVNSHYRNSYNHPPDPSNDGKMKGSYYKTPPLPGPNSPIQLKKRRGGTSKNKGSGPNPVPGAGKSDTEVSYESEEA